MADTLGHSPDRSAFITRNSSAAIAVLLLALAPQIVELLWSLASMFWASGRSPPQVLLAHAIALLAAVPGLLFGLGADAKGALSSETLLALIYSYPLFAIAILTFFVRLKGAQDYFGGVALVAVALFALWASSDLQGARGFSFGAGTVPRMFSGLLLGLGLAIMLVGVLTEGAHLATYAWRGPLFVSLSILSFAITIRPLGLVVSAFASFLISALGTPETRWKETIIVGICLTIGCSLLFPYALGLPLQLFPRFLVQ
ncbi:MAG TPA: tripartite tricarboxylate transporter TctB family protein [Bradyrhizobium sp.]|nr:tripartite tricarboxylate transporter TctB family protein [Bradyrhizobium sp.]